MKHRIQLLVPIVLLHTVIGFSQQLRPVEPKKAPEGYEFLDDFSTDEESDFAWVKTGDGYELYFKKKRIIGGLDEVVYLDDIYRELNLAVVTVQGKQGVIDKTGKWVIPPLYKQAMALPIDMDRLLKEASGEEVGPDIHIYYLDNTEYEPGGDPFDRKVIGPVEVFLAKTDGTLISEQPFQLAKFYMGESEEYRMELLQDGKVVYLRSDLELIRTPYNSIREYLSWQVYDDGEKTMIKDASGNEVAVFTEKISFPDLRVKYTNERGDYYSDGKYFPFVIATKYNGTDSVSALFDLVNRKWMTPWTTGTKTVINEYAYDYGQLYLIQEEKLQRYTYYQPDLAELPGFVFTEMELLDDYYMTAKRVNEADKQLFHFKEEGNFGMLPVRAAEIGWSDQLFGYRKKDRECHDCEPEPVFNPGFVYFKQADGSFGIVCIMNEVVPAQRYDVVRPNKSTYDLLDVSADGKWGTIHTMTGEVVRPSYPSPLVWDEEKSCFPFEKEGYYLSIDGERFYSLEPVYEVYEEQGLYGVRMSSDFPEITGALVTVIPPVYRMLSLPEPEDVYFMGDHFIAEDAQGKFGILGERNDTLVPFLYDAIGPEKLRIGLDDRYVTKAGNKKGLIGLNGETIPAEFDKLTKMDGLYGGRATILVRSEGKSGLYSEDAVRILSCVYDDYFLLQYDYDTAEVYVLKDGKWHFKAVDFVDKVSEEKLSAQQGYDLMIDAEGFVKTAGGYDRYDAFTGKLLEKNIPEDKLVKVNNERYYRLYVESGKIGVLDKKGKEVAPAQFTAICQLRNGSVVTVMNGKPYHYKEPE